MNISFPVSCVSTTVFVDFLVQRNIKMHVVLYVLEMSCKSLIVSDMRIFESNCIVIKMS